VWVSKSGKQGLGVTIAIASHGQPCRVAVRHAELGLADRRVVADALPPPVDIAAAGEHYLYVPFRFDNEASWNRGERAASLTLVLDAGGDAVALELPLEHHRDGPHKRVDAYARPDQPLQRVHQ
jgi:hypothetical protein